MSNNYPYPLTIIKDRYQGMYSRAKFTAWNLKHTDVPNAIDGDDLVCATFWEYNQHSVGKGDTPEEAIQDLKIQLQEKDLND